MLERPLKGTGLFRLPKLPCEKWRWVRAYGGWPPRSTMKILRALRAKIIVLDRLKQVVLIEPESGCENGVWELVIRTSNKLEKVTAEEFLARHASS